MHEEEAKPISIIFEKLWLSSEVPSDWKSGNTTPVFQMGNKEDLGNYSPGSLKSVMGKITEQVILETVLRQMENKEVIGASQYNFIEVQRLPDKFGGFL